MKHIRAARRHLAFAGIAFGMLLSGAAHAQLDLQSIGSSLLGGGQQAAPEQGGVAQLLQAYVGANRQVLAGQSSLASAMGLSGAAGQAQQAASVLGNGDARSTSRRSATVSRRSGRGSRSTRSCSRRSAASARRIRRRCCRPGSIRRTCRPRRISRRARPVNCSRSRRR